MEKSIPLFEEIRLEGRVEQASMLWNMVGNSSRAQLYELTAHTYTPNLIISSCVIQSRIGFKKKT